MNSKWQIHRVGLLDFWYYDEEEFYFLDGRMLLRGANGSGKSVTMQSFIPLLLDGNMRPERLDPFGSRARKMENYLLEENDEREERIGYLYMELKRTESDEFLTIGIGMRARRNKKLESWYFCITDGRRVGKDFYLYKEGRSKVACTKLELRNRIGEGGRVMETQGEYAQCVNRLLFGFETPEEYKELLDLLIQLRTPKLSKDFKPTIINEILSSSLQTLTEEDLRPMSEAIENMDNLKVNLDTLEESVRAASQIEKVYDQYNEITLYDKALLFMNAEDQYRKLQNESKELLREIDQCRKSRETEEQHYLELEQEERVCQAEKESLSDSDAARLKKQEAELKNELKETEKNLAEKKRQEEEKEEKYRETERKRKEQFQNNELLWEKIETYLDEMEEEIGEIPFDDFAFLQEELKKVKGSLYSFESHGELLESYRKKIEQGKKLLTEEKNCQERYGRCLQELDSYQENRNCIEREMFQYENQLHETKQELIEHIYQWEMKNKELKLQPETLQKMSRGIEAYTTETDYWTIREIAAADFEHKSEEISHEIMKKSQEIKISEETYEQTEEELQQWRTKKEPEPERSREVEQNRELLREKGIPYLEFYKTIDFDQNVSEEKKAHLEEALLHMGILDALIVPEEYRNEVLSIDEGMCDRYIFSDVSYVRDNVMDFLGVDNENGDILFYQKVSKILTAIGWKRRDERNKEKTVGQGSWIDENGNYGMGIVEGTITRQYRQRFIGIAAREQYRLRKVEELEECCRSIEQKLQILQEELLGVKNRKNDLETEWKNFPEEKDLRVAARELEKKVRLLEDINEKIQRQKILVEKERKQLDEVRMRVQEICQKCYLSPRLDVFTETSEALDSYRGILTKLQISYGSYVNGVEVCDTQKKYLEEVDEDLEQIRYERNQIARSESEKKAALISVMEQLELTDYEEIKERLDDCIKRLLELPSELKESLIRKTKLDSEETVLLEKQRETETKTGEARHQKEWYGKAFEMEEGLDYVKFPFSEDDDLEERARKICKLFSVKFENKKQSEIGENLQAVYHQNRGSLLEYQVTLKKLFEELDEETGAFGISLRRVDISAKYRGTSVAFKDLLLRMREDVETQRKLLSDKDRELFEDILTNTISKKIRAKIQGSKRWVEKMNCLMESMKTSSGLILSLRWKSKRADKEEQLDTRALVELLSKDAEIMRPEETEQLSKHFRSKIEEARKTLNDVGNVQSFHGIMRNVLDYRQWFEFQLECQKTGEKKKELTDRVFFTFSGGEKAMSMYVPLFSAVVAKYAGARNDAPYLISLDEAFAGVDETNIRDMFRLMVEFDFNFMINSQILWGDYDTVPGIAIYQLVRPENAKYVTVIRYVWNGKIKRMVVGRELQHGAGET